MRIRFLPVLVLMCACTEQVGLKRGDDAATGSDGRGFEDAGDVASTPKDAGSDAVTDSASPGADLLVRNPDGGDSALGDSAVEAPADVARDAAAFDGAAADVDSGCPMVVPQMSGDTVGGMAEQCTWTSVSQPGAPAVAIAVSGGADAMAFQVRVDVSPEAYLHQGYVSVPALAELGPLSMQGMDVSGPMTGASKGQYVFDLRWANQVAPREGMRIVLTASFSFACSQSMSRTIPVSAKAELVLCRGGAGNLVWRGPGESCDVCTGAVVDAGMDGQGDSQWRWQKVEVASGFSARAEHVAMVFKDKMWVLGGQGSDGKDRNDVWSSTDGSQWSLVTGSAAWSPRNLHRGVVFRDKMWIIDGVRQSDVWSSENGADWTKVVEPAAFSPRYAGQVVVFADKMWIIGGYGASGAPMNDVWSSSDGKAWNLAVANAPWAARDLHTCIVARGKIWIFDGERLGDVWASSDGIRWDEVPLTAAFPPRMAHSSVDYGGKLWIFGGYGKAGSPIDDVWMSDDGATWVQQAAHAPWGPRQLSTALVFKDKAWLLGGSDGERRLSDVWTLTPQ